MRLFLDTNVWISAFVAQGLCADLVLKALEQRENPPVLLYSPTVKREALRILSTKLRATERHLRLFEQGLAFAQGVDEAEPQGEWVSRIPDADNIPILAAALAAGADLFVTGDKALLVLGEIEGLPIVDVRTAYERLHPLR